MIFCFSLFYIIVNWIYLHFGLLVKQNKTLENINLDSGKLIFYDFLIKNISRFWKYLVAGS